MAKVTVEAMADTVSKKNICYTGITKLQDHSYNVYVESYHRITLLRGGALGSTMPNRTTA